MPQLAFVVLVLGYMIFGNFWWILWLIGGLLALFPLVVCWAAYLEWRNRRAKCAVCRNWIGSILMIDADATRRGATIGEQHLCKKHATRRAKIWMLEKDLGFPLSGADAKEVERWLEQRKKETL